MIRPTMRVVRALLPFCLTILLLGLLAVIVDTRAVWRQLSGLHPAPAALAVLAMIGLVAATTIRYRVVLLTLAPESRIRFAPLFQLNMMSLFSAHILPFGAMADGLRALASLPLLEIRPSVAVEAVVSDRILAMTGVMLLGLPATAAQAAAGWDARIVLVQAAAYGGGAVALLFAPLAAKAAAARRFGALLDRLVRALGRLFSMVRSLRGAALQLGLSAAVLGLFTLMLILLAHGLDVRLPLWVAFAVAPTVYLSQVVPIFYGGFGSREAAMVLLMSAGGVMAQEDAVALSLAVGVCNLVASLPAVVFAGPMLRAMRAARATVPTDAEYSAPGENIGKS